MGNHPAETYHRIRRIVFCTYNDPKRGPAVAKKFLEGYRNKLGHEGYVGLKAELAFYDRHKDDYGLTVAGDMGEHADFSGVLDHRACRFDVTTTLAFKTWDEFEPFLGQGVRYKIALLNHNTFELTEVLDLGFKRCADCADGFLIPCVTLMSENRNSHGESSWSNDQLLVDICTCCHTYVEQARHTHHWMFTNQEMVEAAMDIEDAEQTSRGTSDVLDQHNLAIYKYFRREFNDRLMAVAEHGYSVDEPSTGGGHWAMQMVFKNKAVADNLPNEIKCTSEL